MKFGHFYIFLIALIASCRISGWILKSFVFIFPSNASASDFSIKPAFTAFKMIPMVPDTANPSSFAAFLTFLSLDKNNAAFSFSP